MRAILPVATFELCGRDHFVLAFDFRDASAHELGGAQAANYCKFKGIAAGWTSNHWFFLALVRG